ncbi:MAG: ester cyclase [Chloroflexi bacterium]|nr:ester cyclase [Chloroflexota bacterium]
MQTKGNLAIVDELFAPSFVDRTPMLGVSPDREGVKRLFAMFRVAFPDMRAVIHDQVAEDDRVATRKSFYATHLGELMGIPPTGKSVRIDVFDVLRLENGQVVEHWGVVDQLGLMQQLGVIPAPADPVTA